jgi:hypothetical protein
MVKLNSNRKKIFLIDAIGAMLSVASLVAIYFLENFFGMPKAVIIVFIVIASLFSVYSMACYRLNPRNWKLYLRMIASCNIVYCLFTIYQVVVNAKSLTLLGYSYFVIEILIILILAGYELRQTRRQLPPEQVDVELKTGK